MFCVPTVFILRKIFYENAIYKTGKLERDTEDTRILPTSQPCYSSLPKMAQDCIRGMWMPWYDRRKGALWKTPGVKTCLYLLSSVWHWSCYLISSELQISHLKNVNNINIINLCWWLDETHICKSMLNEYWILKLL